MLIFSYNGLEGNNKSEVCLKLRILKDFVGSFDYLVK